MTELPARGPFDLLFADGGWQDSGLAGLVWGGGRVVMDDVTPLRLLPSDSTLRGNDRKREFFFAEPRLIAAEVVLPDLRLASGGNPGPLTEERPRSGRPAPPATRARCWRLGHSARRLAAVADAAHPG
jgi:hypothetical protein